MSRISEFKPVAYSFPDSLNLFEGGRELKTTFGSDYADSISGKVKFISTGPPDCISFSTDRSTLTLFTFT